MLYKPAESGDFFCRIVRKKENGRPRPGGFLMQRNRRWLWAGLALLVCGCGGEDVDRLGRICTMATAKVEDAAGGSHGKLANGWQAMCGAISDTTPEARVAVRLHWDKQLADADIQ